jgi:hypothetical protein
MTDTNLDVARILIKLKRDLSIKQEWNKQHGIARFSKCQNIKEPGPIHPGLLKFIKSKKNKKLAN